MNEYEAPHQKKEESSIWGFPEPLVLLPHCPLLFSELEIQVRNKSATHGWLLAYLRRVSGIKETVPSGDNDVFRSVMANRELTEVKLDFEIPLLKSLKTARLPGPLLCKILCREKCQGSGKQNISPTLWRRLLLNY